MTSANVQLLVEGTIAYLPEIAPVPRSMLPLRLLGQREKPSAHSGGQEPSAVTTRSIATSYSAAEGLLVPPSGPSNTRMLRHGSCLSQITLFHGRGSRLGRYPLAVTKSLS